MEAQKERRLFVRYSVSFLVDHGVSKGMLFNLSMGGCAIESATPVQLGTVTPLRVHLPLQDPPIEVELAEVAWTAGQDFGVRFLRLEPGERVRLRQLITDLQQGIQGTAQA